MKLKLNNGTEFGILCVNGSTRYYQSAQRDSLEIHVTKSTMPFAELDKLFADKVNTSKITIVDGENTYLHEDYTLRVSMELKPVEIEPATTMSQAVTEERIIITMAQMTFIEKQLERLGIESSIQQPSL